MTIDESSYITVEIESAGMSDQDFRFRPTCDRCQLVSIALSLLLVFGAPTSSCAQGIVLEEIGHWSGRSEAVAVDGTLVYAGVDSSLVVLDVGDPAQPVEVGRIWIGARPRDVALRGTFAYVVDDVGQHLHAVDVSDPSSPDLVASASTELFPTAGHRIVLHDTLAYVTAFHLGCHDAVHVFDLSDPGSPRRLPPGVSLGSCAYDVAPADGRLYVFTGHMGLFPGAWMWKIRSLDPQDVEFVDVMMLDGEPVYGFAAAISEPYLFINTYFRFIVADVSSPFEPSLVATLSTSPRVDLGDVRLTGGRAYVAGRAGGSQGAAVHVVDVEDPAKPRLLASYEISPAVEKIAVQGDLIFLATRQGGLRILRERTESDPVSVGPGVELPQRAMLEAAYPNPTRDVTSIRFALPDASHVRLAVYDVLGREVGVLVDGMRAAGRHEVTWHGQRVPAGLYIIRLEAEGATRMQPVTLVR